MEVLVIGGGPAGMLAGISSAENGNNVTIIEKMNQLGRKLLITGKGRCNITSSIPISEFIKNIPGNGKFLYSAFMQYTNEDILRLMHENGIETKVERGNRVFPVTDKSKDVLDAFIKRLKQLNIKIMLNTKVINVLESNNKINGVEIIKDNIRTSIKADKVIIATGGRSYSLTGSTGDGYELAKKLGHTITNIKPSLVPMEVKNDVSLQICKQMQGLSLKNVKITLKNTENNEEIYNDFGEMIFTHFGVSGPTILSASAHLVRYKNIQALFENGKVKLIIDLKPALTEEQLDNRLQRDFEQFKNKQFKNSLDKLLPQKMISTIVKLSKIEPEKQVNSITKEERKRLVGILKHLELEIKDFRPIDEAIITSGGINIKEINPKTMESKIIKGLYFAGEIIDVDAYTGGFNLQIAYSTGYVAGAN